MESLDRAAADPKVSAVVVRVSFLPDAGWGKVQELRDAVARFRKSGKPAYAHLEFCGNKEYYLATACSKIYALPTAILDVSGLSAEVTFFRQGLDKLGVEAQFEGVGKYKNAPNQFTESAFTGAAPRADGGPRRQPLRPVPRPASRPGAARPPRRCGPWWTQGPYDAAAGAPGRPRGRAALPGPARDEAQGGRAGHAQPLREGRPRLLLRRAAEGRPRLRRRRDRRRARARAGPSAGSVAGSDTVAGALRQAREDDAVKAVVLRVDSPGGFGPAADAIWREVSLARKAKPVVVSMGDYAASGGYYVSMAGDVIVAEPGTLTGSIGVFSGKFSLRGLYDKLGITKEILTRGRNAALYSEYRPWSRGGARQGAGHERGLLRGVREEGRGGAQDVLRGDRRRGPGARLDGRRRPRARPGGPAGRAGRGPRGRQGEGRDRARSGRWTSWSSPSARGSSRRSWSARRTTCTSAALPSDLKLLLRFVGVLGDGAPMARLPFDLRIR